MRYGTAQVQPVHLFSLFVQVAFKTENGNAVVVAGDGEMRPVGGKSYFEYMFTLLQKQSAGEGGEYSNGFVLLLLAAHPTALLDLHCSGAADENLAVRATDDEVSTSHVVLHQRGRDGTSKADA
jgi:hypothetical protein